MAYNRRPKMPTPSVEAGQCPRCGGDMRPVHGRNGWFWSCSNYRSLGCNSTRNWDEPPIPYKSQMDFNPSRYQTAIFEFIQNPELDDAVVIAAAGSGKTTTILKALAFAKGYVAFFAFNKAIANELKRKAPPGVHVSTLHGHGFAALRMALPHLNADNSVEPRKKWNLAKEILPDIPEIRVMGQVAKPPQSQKYERGLLVKLTSLVQNTLTDPHDIPAVMEVIDHYGVETNGSLDLMLNLLPTMIQLCMERTEFVDYDDMIWLPVWNNLETIDVFDWVFIDEAQDLNKAQIELVLRSVTPTGRMIAVGDPNQSIYGFRGADTEAIPNLIAAMSNTTELPLSITYRCPKSHVRLAQQLVPEIEAAEDAEEGEVHYNVAYTKALAAMKPGDLGLCRMNAPLVKAAYLLIRSGKKAMIKGRDIGKGLIDLIDKLQPVNMEDLSIKLTDYRLNEVKKLAAADKEHLISAIEDKVSTIFALMDGVNNLSTLRANIDRIFKDQVDGVVFSSVHRAKGLEADNVVILEPHLMPFPKATMLWELEQEVNILYVALTRAKQSLTFVEGSPNLQVRNQIEMLRMYGDVEEDAEELEPLLELDGEVIEEMLQVAAEVEVEEDAVSLASEVANAAFERSEGDEISDDEIPF